MCQAAFAPGTSKNLQTQWSTYIGFARFCNTSWKHPSRDLLAAYALYLATHFKTVDSVKNYIAGVKTLFVLLDLPLQAFEDVNLRLTLRGLARLKPHCPRRAAPFTPTILLNIYAILDMTQPTHLVFWTLSVFAFFTFARRSNLVCSTAALSPRHHIMRKHVVFHGNSLLVMFLTSKTNQTGATPHLVPLMPILGSPLCPVSSVLKMCATIPAPPEAPLFMLPGGTRHVNYSQLSKFIKDAVAAIGLDPSAYSSHSYRRGGASYAFSLKIPGELIKAQGAWRSDAYLCYLDLSLRQKLSVAEVMTASLQNIHAC